MNTYRLSFQTMPFNAWKDSDEVLALVVSTVSAVTIVEGVDHDNPAPGVWFYSVDFQGLNDNEATATAESVRKAVVNAVSADTFRLFRGKDRITL